MNRFFVSPAETGGDNVIITGANLTHIRLSLRLRAGERIAVCDGLGNDYICVLDKISDDMALARVEECRKSMAEPACKINLFFALPKGDKAELIIEKAVELGVSEITPFISSRCISRPDEKALAKKIARWQALALSAAKQSGRGVVPTVNEAVSYDKALAIAAEYEKCLFFFENADNKTIEPRHAQCKSLALFTGAEGGFSDEETARAASLANCEVLTLGSRILRCETAPLAVLSVLAHYETINACRSEK